MHDDPLDWLDAALLLTDAAKALWPSLDSTNRERLLAFVESQGHQLLSLAEELRSSRN